MKCIMILALSLTGIWQPAQAAPEWNIQIAPPPGIQWQQRPPGPTTTIIRNVSPAVEYVYVEPDRVQNFNINLRGMRRQIAAQLSSGLLTADDASALNAKLDGLVKLEYQYQANGGVTQAQLSQLYLNLRRVRVASRRSTWFF